MARADGDIHDSLEVSAAGSPAFAIFAGVVQRAGAKSSTVVPVRWLRSGKPDRPGDDRPLGGWYSPIQNVVRSLRHYTMMSVTTRGSGREKRPMITRMHITSWAAVAVACYLTIGCGGLLDVSNPTLIQDSDIANTSGANAQRLNER